MEGLASTLTPQGHKAMTQICGMCHIFQVRTLGAQVLFLNSILCYEEPGALGKWTDSRSEAGKVEVNVDWTSCATKQGDF